MIILKIEDFMSQPPITLKSDNTVGEAIGLMKEHNIGSIVIIDDDSLPENIITQKDIINLINDNFQINPKAKLNELPVKRTLITIFANDSYDNAIEQLSKHYIHHLIVINPSGVVVGILSTSDIIKAQLRYNRFFPYFPTNQLIH